MSAGNEYTPLPTPKTITTEDLPSGLASAPEITMAEEPIQERLDRAYLNGYNEGFREGFHRARHGRLDR